MSRNGNLSKSRRHRRPGAVDHGQEGSKGGHAEIRAQGRAQFSAEKVNAFHNEVANFAQQRFSKIAPVVAKAFFRIASPQELHLPELRNAFELYFLYGWADAQGMRILDMFFREKKLRSRERIELGQLFDHIRFSCVEVLDKQPENKLFKARNLLSDETIELFDKSSFSHAGVGDVLTGWMFPSASFWRPLGAVVHTPQKQAAQLQLALKQLLVGLENPARQLGHSESLKLFWLSYRVAQASSSS